MNSIMPFSLQDSCIEFPQSNTVISISNNAILSYSYVSHSIALRMPPNRCYLHDVLLTWLREDLGWLITIRHKCQIYDLCLSWASITQ